MSDCKLRLSIARPALRLRMCIPAPGNSDALIWNDQRVTWTDHLVSWPLPPQAAWAGEPVTWNGFEVLL